MTRREQLGRIFGPDTLEALADFIYEQVDKTLNERDHERRWLSVAAAADYLGLSEKAIRRRIERGTIAYTRLRGRVLIDRRALDAQSTSTRRG
jgi:excisionase family DNA binding protein